MPKNATLEVLVSCPDCGQENFHPRALATHRGSASCKRKIAAMAKKSAVIPYEEAAKSFAIVANPTPLQMVDVIRWLEAALPVYERSRGQLATRAVIIGYALICVRDHGAKGALTALKKMQVFARSQRTLDRCVKAAQIYAEARGLTTPAGKLTEVREPEALFHPEFDFDNPDSHSLCRDIAEYVGDQSIADLMEKDALESDEDGPPQDHQSTSAKKRSLKETAEIKRAKYQKAFQAFHVLHGAGDWRHLYLHGDPAQKRLGTLDLEKALEAALKAVREHNKTESAKEKR